MSTLVSNLAAWLDVSAQTATNLLTTLVILMVMGLVRSLVLRVVRRNIQEVTRHYHWRRAINYAAGVLALLLVGRVWVTGLRNLGTFFGLLSAGIAIALSDLLANLAGWAFILTRRPYQVGDRVEIDGNVGDVVDVRLFTTYLVECGKWVDADQSTGRMVLVPNGYIFKKAVANYTRDFAYIWDEIPVLITFESDWRRAKAVLSAIVNTHGQPLSEGAHKEIQQAGGKHMIVFRNLKPIVYTSVKDSGVLLTLRYLTPPRQRRGNAERIWEAILDAFAREPRVDLAYPTQRAYLNLAEGKPATVPLAWRPAAPAGEEASASGQRTDRGPEVDA